MNVTCSHFVTRFPRCLRRHYVSNGGHSVILVILAGVKPLERRFISVKQQRTSAAACRSIVFTRPSGRAASGSSSSSSSSPKTIPNSTTCRSDCLAPRTATSPLSVHDWRQCPAFANAETPDDRPLGSPITAQRGHIRTASAAIDDTTASAITPAQPHCARAKLPMPAPAAMPMNMPTNSTAFKRLRDAGSMP